jgi:hypothetical protein
MPTPTSSCRWCCPKRCTTAAEFEPWLEANPDRCRRHPIPDWNVVDDDEMLNTVDQLTGLLSPTTR